MEYSSHKNKYIEDLFKKFKMYECKFVSIPLVMNEKLYKVDKAPEVDASRYTIVESLFYLTTTRPSIMFTTHFYQDSCKPQVKLTLA